MQAKSKVVAVIVSILIPVQLVTWLLFGKAQLVREAAISVGDIDTGPFSEDYPMVLVYKRNELVGRLGANYVDDFLVGLQRSNQVAWEWNDVPDDRYELDDLSRRCYFLGTMEVDAIIEVNTPVVGRIRTVRATRCFPTMGGSTQSYYLWVLGAWVKVPILGDETRY